jgi:LacI family transcriptional regulator
MAPPDHGGGDRQERARRSATLAEIAERAGVSKATASRVFAAPGTAPAVSAAARRRVMKAASELGWRPHRAARTLSRRRSALIGALMPGFGGGFIGPVMDGVAAVAERARYEVMFTRYGSAEADITRGLESLLEMRVEGVLLYPSSSVPIEGERVAQELHEVPCVLIDQAVSGLSLPLVTGDHVGGMRQVARHLASLGHARIGYLAGPSWNWTADLRLSAFRAALKDHGLQLPDHYVTRYNWTWERAVTAAERLLGSKTIPTAVATANDVGAGAVLQVARDMGLQVPGDLAVIGYGDTMLSHAWVPPLTTVRQAVEGLGEAACRLLLHLMEDPASQDRVPVPVLPTELVVRGSCGGIPAPARAGSWGAEKPWDSR